MAERSTATRSVNGAVATTPDGQDVMVVGIDGSTDAAHALAWAATRTERFGLIKGVAAWTYPAWAISDPVMGAAPLPIDDFKGEAHRLVVDTVSSIPSELRLAPVVVNKSAGAALVEQGSTANLIVIGTRGRGAIADTVLGSVSSHVAAHAEVPVAVIPESAPLTPAQRVVVAVDGSTNSVAALAWAMRTTEPGVELVAVHVWSFSSPMTPTVESPAVSYSEKEGGRTLEQTVAAASRLVPGHSHEVKRQLVYGDPLNALRAFASGADLLVVGARGHRGLAGLLLGSVTSSLVHQPLVATVVIPSGDVTRA